MAEHIDVAHRWRVRSGRTTYRVRYRDPGGGQRSKVFARKADAQRFLNETETAKARGTWTDPSLGRVLFRDWLGEWWATTTNLRPKTRDRDELLLRRMALPSFGAVPLAAISQRDVRAWVAELSARGLAPPRSRRPTSSSARCSGRRWTPGCWRSRRVGGCRCPRSSARRCGS
jgi:hypothetical protein